MIELCELGKEPFGESPAGKLPRHQSFNIDIGDIQLRSTLPRENEQFSGDILSGEIIARIGFGQTALPMRLSTSALNGTLPSKLLNK